MPAIHTDLQAHLNEALGAVDADVAIEQLEDAVEKIDAALGWTQAAGTPELEGSAADALAEARTYIRNDDLAAARIRLLQVIEAGGPDVTGNVAADKPLDAMKKAELIAYAAAHDIPVSQSSPKAAILEQIQEAQATTEAELDAGGES